MRSRPFIVLMSVLVPTIVATAPAAARKPEDVLGGKIVLSDQPFSSQVKSPEAYLAAVKKQAKDKFWEDKEKTGWKVYYAAFFKKPVNDLEVNVKIYDVSSGTKRIVESYQQYLNARGQRAIVGNMKLRKGEGGYDPNAKILMEMDTRGQTVAQAIFYIQGEGKKYSGKVQFTNQETHEDEDPDAAAEVKGK